MKNYWEEVESLLQNKNVDKLIKLNKGASSKALQQLEKVTGFLLPDSFKEFYKIHDGQKDGFGLIFGIELLPIKKITDEWESWKDLLGDGLNEELADNMKSKPAGFVKKLYINEKWLPFTHDQSGNHLGIDFDPDKKGTIEQIITFGRDEDTKRFRESSFEEFIKKYISELNTLSWSIDEDDGWEVNHKKYGSRHYHEWY